MHFEGLTVTFLPNNGSLVMEEGYGNETLPPPSSIKLSVPAELEPGECQV